MSTPAIRLEEHFGDRSVRCFVERPRSLWAMAQEGAARSGGGEALVCGARRWSWPALIEEAARCAGGLEARAVTPGQRVLLLLRNRAEFVIAGLALARLGAVAVPLSVRSAPPEVAYVAQHCGAVLAIVEDDLVGHLPATLPRLPVSAFAACAGAVPPVAAVDEEDTAVILYTSGTTGRPKGAMLSHLNIVHSALHYEVAMALTTAERSVAAVPLSHVTGLVAQAWTMARCGGTLVLLDAFHAGDFLRLASTERITHTVLVPAMYQLCLLQQDMASFDLKHWRVGAFGGAPMAPAVIAALAQALPGLGLVNCYGATETASPATIMPRGETVRRPTSVGRAVACGELCIVDESGQVLPPGNAGEVWIRGPMVVRGYWDNPQASREQITLGWWHSGDLGKLDDDGYLHLLDRIKDVINRGGYKVFSSEVEAVLLQHPAVVEAAVVGFACPVLGERVQAFVCWRVPVEEAALAAFCAARVADYKVPERWSLAPEPLPRNANGKLMKKALRDTAR